MKLKYVFNCLFFGFSVVIISAQNVDLKIIANTTNSLVDTKNISYSYSLDYGLKDLVAFSLYENKYNLKATKTLSNNTIIKNALTVLPKALTNNHNSNIIQDKTIETKINLL